MTMTESLRRNKSGFTLIELMIVVVILAIIAAIAYPSYTQYVTRSKRTVAKSFLSQVADRQEQFFLDNKRYAAGLAALGHSADSIGITDEGAPVADTDANRIYVISLANVSARTFTANASPALVQATRDTACAVLSLDHQGRKEHSGPGSDCW